MLRRKVYYTYFSRVKSQSALFVRACMEVLLERIPKEAIGDADAMTLWTDRGRHFNATSMIGWWRCKVPEKYRRNAHLRMAPAGAWAARAQRRRGAWPVPPWARWHVAPRGRANWARRGHAPIWGPGRAWPGLVSGRVRPPPPQATGKGAVDAHFGLMAKHRETIAAVRYRAT